MRIARVFAHRRFEPIMIGNAAAALHGAPVTTVDFDFFFRKTAANLTKLKQIAGDFRGALFRPYYPISSLVRLSADEDGIQLDFMSRADGIKSYPSLRARAIRVNFGDDSVLIASLEDVIKSKRASGRDRDKAVLPILERVLRERDR